MSRLQYDQLITLLAHVDPAKKIAFTKDYIKQQASEEERDQLQLYCDLLFSQTTEKAKVVVVVHGIRTQAEWFESMASELRMLNGFKVEMCRYEYVDALTFSLPFLFAKTYMDKVLMNFNSIFSENGDADVYLVAHSFGTYLSTKILETNPHFKFKKIVFCGSIVKQNFGWDKLKNFPSDGFVNDCGTRDIWPIVAKIATFGYGTAGRYGFNSHKVRDRFHNLSHSEFFTTDFYHRFWVPFLAEGKMVSPETESNRPVASALIGVVSRVEGLLMIMLVVVVAVAVLFLMV